MTRILVFSPSNASEALPSLALLNYSLQTFPLDSTQIKDFHQASAILLDARTELAKAKTVSQNLAKILPDLPLLLVVTEGGFSAIQSDWSASDIILTTAGPAEIEARIRLAVSKKNSGGAEKIFVAGVTIDEASYAAKLHGKPLDLTFKEFELLRFLAANPSRVFTREQLLSEVWGYDYFGGTRTVDVHIRRLRAKLGEFEQIIGTVRNVGYRFNPDPSNKEELED